jgi:hypothetical protein
MRRILIEQAPANRRRKHGGDRRRIELDQALDIAYVPSEDLLELDEAPSSKAKSIFLNAVEIADPGARAGLPRRRMCRR